MKTLRYLQVSNFLIRCLLIVFFYYLVTISIPFPCLHLAQRGMGVCHESLFQACPLNLNEKLRNCCWQEYFFPHRACCFYSIFVEYCHVLFEQGDITTKWLKAFTLEARKPSALTPAFTSPL